MLAQATALMFRSRSWTAVRLLYSYRSDSNDASGAAREGSVGAGTVERRTDSANSRYCGAVQGNQRARHQEGADAARIDGRESVFRKLHAYSHIVRIRGE